jgi:multidrug efflux system outer membrane protein
MRLRIAAVCLIAVLLTGCTVGPNYSRPKINVPSSYRGQMQAPKANVSSLGDEKWWQVFQDPVLQQLIRTALKQNYNVQIAASRILQAQQQIVITRSNKFPNIGGSANYTSQRIPGLYTRGVVALEGSVSWILDFWGQYRRATQAARAALLEQEWNRRAVIATLVSDVAASYFQLRALDLQLQISERTLGARQQSLQLTDTLYKGGANTLLDVREAEQLVQQAAAAIPDLQRQIAQQENAISILLGENPRAIARGKALREQPLPKGIPAGLPSSLLERRPDVRAQEQTLIAANANIGVAKAQLFPTISLTGTGGVQSRDLTDLISTGALAWNATGGLTQPIFNAGALRANVKIARAQQHQALLAYKQTIQTAFEEVSDALIAYRKNREFAQHQAQLTTAAQDAAHLSEIRFKGGVTNYLEVLTNEANYFNDQLTLVTAQLNERLALVQVYNALGGGWQ